MMLLPALFPPRYALRWKKHNADHRPAAAEPRLVSRVGARGLQLAPDLAGVGEEAERGLAVAGGEGGGGGGGEGLGVGEGGGADEGEGVVVDLAGGDDGLDRLTGGDQDVDGEDAVLEHGEAVLVDSHGAAHRLERPVGLTEGELLAREAAEGVAGEAGLAGEVEGVGGRGLHPVGGLQRLDAGVQCRVGAGGGPVLLVEPAQQVELAALVGEDFNAASPKAARPLPVFRPAP